MNKWLEKYGPWALVTGASSGLGAEFARQLAARGLNVALVARRAQPMEALKSELEKKHSVDVRVIPSDLSRHDFLPALLDAVKDVEVGLLVNNAGFAISGDFLKQDLSRNTELVHVNVRAPMMLAHAFGNQMATRGHGGIVFTASIVGFMAMPGWSNYAASKAYDLLLAEGIGYELKRAGVDVLALCPGTTRTGFQDVAGTNAFLSMGADKVTAMALNALGSRRTIVAGWHNAMITLATRFGPRFVNTLIASMVFKQLSKTGSGNH